MSFNIDQNCTLFIVDTTSYAGNFEREMVAYMTGHVGECEVGQEIATRAIKEYAKSKGDGENPQCEEEDEEAYFGLPTPIQFSDGNGCWRPASIWLTESWINDGNGKFRRSDKPGRGAYHSVVCAFDKLTTEQIKILTQRAKDFCQNYGKIVRHSYGDPSIPFTGVRVVRRKIVVTDTVLHVETVS